MWVITRINNFIWNDRRNDVTEVTCNNNKITSPEEIPKLLNRYFGTVASNLQSHIPASTSTTMTCMGKLK